jgi:hypothetical protein
MNWRRGLFRLWIVTAALFVLVVVFVSYSEIKAEFEAAASRPETVTSSFISEFRRLHPEYNGLSDAQLADAVHSQFYSDMSREQFDKKLAEKIEGPKTKTVKFQGQLYEYPRDATDEEIADVLKDSVKNPWATVRVAAAIAISIPLVVLVVGSSLVWAFSGFAAGRF